MRINHNIASLNTYRQLSTNNINTSKSLEKLSSGLRINRAGDDAAGLAISEKMRGQIRGLTMASKNSQDSISLIQTAEGALNETHSILQRMRELGVQAANDTNVTIDRTQIQKEINQLTSEINRIGNTTEFNTMKLLNGDRAKTAATSEMVLNSGTVDVSFASGVSGDADMLKAVGEIEIEAGSEYANSLSSSTATIDITKTSTGITVQLVGGTAASTVTVTDQITADADGNYTYNNHGVSFTISAADAAALSTGETVGFAAGSITGAGTYSTESDYTYAGTATVSVSDITVTASNDNKAIRNVTFQATTAGYTVELQDSAGTTIDTDDFTAAQGSFTYNNHGISFTIDNTNLSGGGTFSGTISLTGLGTTQNVLTYDDKSLKFQVGANENQAMTLDVSDMRSAAIKVSSTTAGGAYVSTKNVTNGTSSTTEEFALDISTHDKAAAAVTVIDSAITAVSEERSKLGAVQNRLEHTINNLDAAAENLQASESRIRDVDMAKEMMEFTKNNILTQAAQSMLAQANQQPQGVLQLLR